MDRSKGHILIADNDPQTLADLEQNLIQKGHVVSTYSAFPEVLSSLADSFQDYDAILCEADAESVGRLRGLRPDIPIITITALERSDEAFETLQAGAYDYLIKPLNFSEVEASLKRAVQFHRLERENALLRREVMAQNDVLSIKEMEKRCLAHALQKAGGRKEKAAQILGISRKTLYRKEKEFGLS